MSMSKLAVHTKYRTCLDEVIVAVVCVQPDAFVHTVLVIKHAQLCPLFFGASFFYNQWFPKFMSMGVIMHVHTMNIILYLKL